jgi:predicted DNA-binding ribbon-helix-helix protein
MKSPVAKWSVVVGGHKTSVSVEEPFWNALKEISRQRGLPLYEVVNEIDKNRQQGNLSRAIRLFVLDHFKSRAAGPTGESRQRNGHPPVEASLGR